MVQNTQVHAVQVWATEFQPGDGDLFAVGLSTPEMTGALSLYGPDALDADDRLLQAVPWADGKSPWPVVVAGPHLATRVQLLIEECNARRWPIAVWDAPRTFGVLRARFPALSRPQWVLDCKVIDRQLNPERRGRRTVESTAWFYECPTIEDQVAARAETERIRLIGEQQLIEHRLAMPLEDLMATQRQWHRQQTHTLARIQRKRGRPDDVNPAWPIREPRLPPRV